MKYTVSIDLDLPRERVIELLEDLDNMEKWFEGFVGYEHLSGEPGQVGAKMLIKSRHGSRVLEMTETVTKRDLPDEMVFTYEIKGVWNSVANRFIPLDGDRTRWESENEFRFRGFVLRLFSLILPSMFRKQSLKFMTAFKDFAEKGIDVRESK